jgi:hypothetical protein
MRCGDSCKGGAANKAPKRCHKELAKVMIMNTTNIARRHFNCLLINKCFQSVSAKDEVDDADSRSSVNARQREMHISFDYISLSVFRFELFCLKVDISI